MPLGTASSVLIRVRYHGEGFSLIKYMKSGNYIRRTKDIDRLVIKTYRSDERMGTRGVALKLGISRSQVKKILKENNIKRKRPGLKQDFEKEKVSLIISLFKQGKKLKKIKEETGFSDGRIRKVIRDNFKLKYSNYPDYNCIKIETNKDKIIRMYTKEKFTMGAIAKFYQVSVTAIYRYLAVNWKIKAPLRTPSFGRGICGKYKNYYFRSLLELSFLISFIEKKGLKFESGEQRKYEIPYTDETGKKRNYLPDFIVTMGDKKTIFECKPKRLWESERVMLKAKAAQKYAKRNNMNYKMVDCKLCLREIKEKFSQNLLTFNDYNRPKFEKFINNPRNYYQRANLYLEAKPIFRSSFSV